MIMGCNDCRLGLQIRILSKSTGQTIERLEKDISRPRYFNPYDAISYGIIDKVLEFFRCCLAELYQQCCGI